MMVNPINVTVYLAIHPLLIVRNPRTHRAMLAKDTSACGSLSVNENREMQDATLCQK
jgi:hypothetical protein